LKVTAWVLTQWWFTLSGNTHNTSYNSYTVLYSMKHYHCKVFSTIFCWYQTLWLGWGKITANYISTTSLVWLGIYKKDGIQRMTLVYAEVLAISACTVQFKNDVYFTDYKFSHLTDHPTTVTFKFMVSKQLPYILTVSWCGILSIVCVCLSWMISLHL